MLNVVERQVRGSERTVKSEPKTSVKSQGKELSWICCFSPLYNNQIGDTFYIVNPPFYVITPKGKMTNKLQKFRLTRGEQK